MPSLDNIDDHPYKSREELTNRESNYESAQKQIPSEEAVTSKKVTFSNTLQDEKAKFKAEMAKKETSSWS
jgi:hypothetical protein